MTKNEELVKLKILQGKILEVMTGAADESTLDSIRYSDADGSQDTSYRSPKSLMDWYNAVCKRISLLERELQGGGLMTFGTSRYG